MDVMANGHGHRLVIGFDCPVSRTDSQASRQQLADRRLDRQKDGQTDGWVDKRMDRQKGGQTGEWTDRWASIMTNGHRQPGQQTACWQTVKLDVNNHTGSLQAVLTVVIKSTHIHWMLTTIQGHFRLY